MLVQCEFYEVDGEITCDVVCEHCGENAYENVMLSQVIAMVHGNLPVLCKQCEESKCSVCGRFPTPAQEWGHEGLCWECQRKIDITKVVSSDIEFDKIVWNQMLAWDKHDDNDL